MRNLMIGRPRVVIVGDDEPVRDSLRTLFESYRFTVEDYGFSREALRALDTKLPDCLVIDLHSPTPGGLGALHAFGDRLETLPVIVMSGRTDAATKVRALAAGVTAVLEKPVDADELIGVVRSALRAGTRSPAIGAAGR